MRQYVESRGWGYFVYRDHGQSGAKNDRPALTAMLNDVRKRKADVVVVWALDRLARSLKQLLTIAEECKLLGVDLVSLKQNIDSTLPAGRLTFQVLGAVAEFERELLRERVKAVEIVDPHRVRFVLNSPWPDFLVFYATPATGAAWIVPKKYIEKVGDEAFRKQPIGLGPYKFVSNTPGIEIVMEANESYWRKMPSVKRLVFKSVPDETTRAAASKSARARLKRFNATARSASWTSCSPIATASRSSPTRRI